MRENLTELVFILDRSGSMGGLESDTIGGFNAMIKKQQKEEGEAVVSTVLFDDVSEVIHDRQDISKISLLSDKEYYVRGCTALLDAVGNAINHIGNVHKYAREEDRPAKTLFIITTDGMENASKEYTYKAIKKLINRQKERYGWEFMFLGANIDAIEVAGNMGIARSNAVNYNCDDQGIELNYAVLDEAISMVRASKVGELSKKMSSGSWKKRIEEDYERRNR